MPTSKVSRRFSCKKVNYDYCRSRVASDDFISASRPILIRLQRPGGRYSLITRKNPSVFKLVDLKIAVNTRFLLKDRLEGIGWFTHETLKRITQQHPEHEFLFFFDRKYSEEFIYGDNVTPVVLQPPARHPILWYLWFEWSVASALKKHKPDVFLSTDGYCSLRSKTPTTLVVHDLAFENTPEDLGGLVSKYYKYYTPRFVSHSKRLVTVSEFSKGDIQKFYGTSPDKIDVVFNGCKEHLRPISVAEQQKVRAEFTDGQPYFLFVGALHPRKNIANLFKAFDAMKSETGLAHKLVLAGRKGWGTKEIEETFDKMAHKADVVFTDRVSESTLHGLLASAEALTYVPFLEGFGIPIIEAQNCDTPVITSNITSMPEVAGDSACLIDPYDVKSISEGLKKVAKDAEYRVALIQKGKVNRHRFSWQQTADLLWASMMKTVE